MNHPIKRAVALLLTLLLAAAILALPTAAAAATDSLEANAPKSGVSYYGRSALSALPNSAALLYAYDKIVLGVEAANEDIPIHDGTNNLSPTELVTVMDAYTRDYAHHFWLDKQYSYSYNDITVLSVKPKYLMSGAALSSAKAEFESAVTGVLAGISGSMSDFEKELYLHDTLAKRIVYQEGTNAHNAYGALVGGRSVCEGYAEALQYLLHRVGISSFLALGSAGGVNHEWNYVKLGGAWYHVDLTWDDQGSTTYHAYLNVSDSVISEDHLISSAGYTLPTCSSDSMNYFAVKGGAISAPFNATAIGNALKDGGLSASFCISGSKEEFFSWLGENIIPVAQAAGITRAFSYGYSHIGHEVYLVLSVADCTHTSKTAVPASPKTCTEDGNLAYYICNDAGCRKWFRDASCTDEITDKDSVVLKSTGHEFDTSTYGYKGADGHARLCGVAGCSARDTLSPHSPGAAATETTAQTCTDCGFVLQAALGHTVHTPATEWSKDGNSHWHACTGCAGQILDQAAHGYDNACDSDCSVCGYIRAAGHTYDNACDKDCNVCSAPRETSHQMGTDWSSDADAHFHACTVCGFREDVTNHTPGAAATESTAQTCTVCGYMIAPPLSHVHMYGDAWSNDAASHWHACTGCNEPKDLASHADGDGNGICDVCTYVMLVIPETTEPLDSTPVTTEPLDSTPETSAPPTDTPDCGEVDPPSPETDPTGDGTAEGDGSAEASSDGCGSVLGGASLILSTIVLIPAAVAIRKREE